MKLLEALVSWVVAMAGAFVSWLFVMAVAAGVLVAAYSVFGTPGLLIAMGLALVEGLRQLRAGLSQVRSLIDVSIRTESERSARRFELQWFEFSGHARIHFPSMLLRVTSSEDHPARLFHLRRAADGTWQSRMTLRSVEAKVKGVHPVERWWEMQGAEGAWEPIDSAQLEVAYQRFIHAQDVAVLGEGSDAQKTQAELWLEEEEQYVAPREQAEKWVERWAAYLDSLAAEEAQRRQASPSGTT